jgi:hypothetical protein
MKCLLYCTIALPWLYQGADGKWYVTKSKCAQVGCKPARNGYVSFECDCKEAKQLYIYESESPDDEFHSFGNCDFVKENFRRMGLSGDAESTGNILDKYGNYWLYFYHFENVKPIDPMPITQLYKDEDCTIPLTKAPQSYCFAYREKIIYHDWGEPKKKVNLAKIVEKVLVFSIRSPWLCKIANGEKDLEVRKTRIANAGIEYK